MPIYPRKREIGWGLDSYLKNCMLRLFLICHPLPFFPFFFLQPYEGSKGFEACCPHFQQTMQLHEQRMRLKLSMQSNTRQWCMRITQNTIEAHVHPHKYYVRVCAHTNTCVHTMRSTLLQSTHTHTLTHTLTKAIVSHSAQVVQSIRPRTTLCSTLWGLKEDTISFCML